ncbi:hypothetical protein BB561_001489 [Smittium simulii]|uniref:C3H1-type domain-containing protein n=1 Tax=Smittium simulii TaxID=133385 RepID=A0A2T9YUE4_9FUNG|nr:hypothetical protein BB561_001489 [Smittium simulii]
MELVNEEQNLVPVFKTSLQTPQEIDEWIKQRKANYPSESNTKKKMLLELNEEITKIQGEGLVAGYSSSDSSDSDSSSSSDLSRSSVDSRSESELPEILSSKIKVNIPLNPEKKTYNEPNPKKKICKYFLNGRCNKGNDCRFYHPQKGENTNEPSMQETRETGLLEMCLTVHIIDKMVALNSLFRSRNNSRVRKLVPSLKKEILIKSWKIHKGDEVMVTEGKEKGKMGRVIEVFKKRNTLLIDSLNLAKKAVPRTKENPTGLIYKEMPIHYSNVSLIDPTDGMPTRIKVESVFNEEKKKLEERRISIRTGTVIPVARYDEDKAGIINGEMDTAAEEVEKVTYFPIKNTKPMPSIILSEIANRRGNII